MTVKDIALTAAEIVQADDAVRLLSADSDDAQTDADVRTMVRCVNLAVKEACADGFPVCYTREMHAEQKTIPFDSFDPAPSLIRRVTRFGVPVRFAVGADGLTVPRDGKYTVTYTAAPADKNLDDTVSVGVLADADMLAYLAARNFCLVTGRYDEATVWDRRYAAESEKKRMTRRASLCPRVWM